MSNVTTKSVAVLTEEARLLAASKLGAIVEECAKKACAENDPSLPHAKFVLEIAQLAVAEKTPKSAEQNSDPEADTPREKCLAEVLIEKLNSMRVDPVK